MKTWTLDATGTDLRLTDAPEPTLRGGGVVLEVIAAIVPSYTNVLLGGARGSLPTPLTLGVTCVGRVLEVADDVFHVRPGDIVIDNALLDSGDIDSPEDLLVGWTGIGGRGRATARTDAMQALWHDGTFAERALCAKETVIALPGAEAFPDPTILAVLPWLGIAAGGIELADLRAGQSVAVMGATGQLGSAAVLVALARGASRVVAVGRSESSLARLAALDDRVATVRLTGDRAIDAAAIIEAGGGEVDAVVDTLGPVPSADPTLSGYDALRPRGTMVLVGGVREELRIPYGDFMHRRLNLRGSWLYDPSTIRSLWRLIQAGTLDLGAFTAHPVSLDDPAAALEFAASLSSLDFVAVVPGLARP